MPTEDESWPDAFFQQIRIDDPALRRPDQTITRTSEALRNVTSSLLVSRHHFEDLIRFPVLGIHVEQYGSANQPWDNEVATSVLAACTKCRIKPPWQHQWFAVQLSWYVMPGCHRRDLDNFRLKPILDCITRAGAWTDDDVNHVRAIYNEAHLVNSFGEQRVEVSVFGVLQ